MNNISDDGRVQEKLLQPWFDLYWVRKGLHGQREQQQSGHGRGQRQLAAEDFQKVQVRVQKKTEYYSGEIGISNKMESV